MNIAKFVARNIVFPTLNRIGGDRYIRKKSKNNNLVLMFHGVSSKDTTWFSPRHLEVVHFEKLIIYLKNNFNILSAKDMFSNKGRVSNKNGKKNVSITFDDGYLNNLELALPILEKYEVQATFFISTVCQSELSYPTLWADAVTAIQKIGKQDVIEVGSESFLNGISSTGRHLFDAIKSLTCEERDLLLRDLSERYKLDELLNQLDPEIWKMMSKDQLIHFANSPMVEIGSHGHMHYNLGEITLERAIDDVETSTTLLNSWLQNKTEAIAYPDGSYSTELKNKLTELGLKFQFAVSYKYPSDKDDPVIVNRYGISSTTTFDSNVFHLNKAFQTHGF